MKILQEAKEAGTSASLTFTTCAGNMKAKLEVELHPATVPAGSTPTPAATTPAPGGGRRHRRRRRHRGPAAIAKSKARASAHQASLAMPFPPPPPPPPTSTQRLVKVVPRKTGHQPSFWQLDGEGGSEEDDEEDDDKEKEGMREVDGRVYCIFCNVLSQPKPVEWDRTCRPCMFAPLAEEELSPNCSHSCNTAV